MTDASPHQPDTVALSTKVEEAFVSPLTAIRGMLEIIRDFPDLEEDKRHRFVTSALIECSRLERGISELSEAVYAAARQPTKSDDAATDEQPSEFAERINVDPERGLFEIDFSDYVFKSSDIVNRFFDFLDRIIEGSGRQWFLLVNHTSCRVWPEAWVAFAHRGKKIAVNHALATARFDESGGNTDKETHDSRQAALTWIEEQRRVGG